MAGREDKFSAIARQMGKWMDQVLGPGSRSYDPERGWTPAINLCEGEGHYCVTADLAGVKGGEIEVKVEGRNLTFSGYRHVPGAPEAFGKMTMHHMEIDHGPFFRSLELPVDADLDDIEAVYRSGFLRILVPKKS